MRFYWLCTCFLAFTFVSARGQIPLLIQDSVYANLVTPWGDTVGSGSYWAAYSFENSYTDSGNVFFVFTEAQANGERIELENWYPMKFTKDSTAEALSSYSRTRPFTVGAGDTMSYYRELSWQHPTELPAQQVDNFYSDDTLEYVIRLRKASNGVELAVLDSLGVLAQNPSGSPVFYGAGPPMAVQEYVIPSGIGGSTDVYLSFDVRAKGNGQYYTCRSDQVTGKLSDLVTNPALLEYYAVFNGASSKRLSERVEELQGKRSGVLQITPNPVRSGAVRVVASSSMTKERKSLMVFSTDGRMIYSYSSGLEGDGIDVEIKVEESGSYYVVYAVGSEVVGVDMLNVVR